MVVGGAWTDWRQNSLIFETLCILGIKKKKKLIDFFHGLWLSPHIYMQTRKS